MQAGLMRQAIQPYLKTETTDTTGATVFTFNPSGMLNIRADMRNVTRRKSDENQIQPMGAETWECRVRARSVSSSHGISIDYGDQIKFKNNFYEIIGIEDVRELQYELILTLERVEIS